MLDEIDVVETFFASRYAIKRDRQAREETTMSTFLGLISRKPRGSKLKALAWPRYLI